MKCSWRKLITALLVLVVIYVFVSPYFALDPSANRAQRAALQLMLSIMAVTAFVFGLQDASLLLAFFPEVDGSVGSTDPSILSCISLC